MRPIISIPQTAEFYRKVFKYTVKGLNLTGRYRKGVLKREGVRRLLRQQVRKSNPIDTLHKKIGEGKWRREESCGTGRGWEVRARVKQHLCLYCIVFVSFVVHVMTRHIL